MTQFRPGGFQMLPFVVKNLIIINVLVLIAQTILPSSGINLDNTFALHTWQSELFKPWQFITYMFMHADFWHLFFNMFALWVFGAALENLWGPKRFLTFYIIAGLGAALCHMIVLFYENQQIIHEYMSINTNDPNYTSLLKTFLDKYNIQRQGYVTPELAQTVINDNFNVPTIGASGAVFGCLAAFGYLFPNDYLYIFGVFPLKAKWVVILYIVVELFSTFQNSAGDNVAHVAHLGGALAGILMVYFWNKTNRRTY